MAARKCRLDCHGACRDVAAADLVGTLLLWPANPGFLSPRHSVPNVCQSLVKCGVDHALPKKLGPDALPDPEYVAGALRN